MDDPLPSHRVKKKIFVHAELFVKILPVGPIGCNPSRLSFFLFFFLSKIRVPTPLDSTGTTGTNEYQWSDLYSASDW